MMEIEDPADLSPNDESPVEETDFMIPAHTPMVNQPKHRYMLMYMLM